MKMLIKWLRLKTVTTATKIISTPTVEVKASLASKSLSTASSLTEEAKKSKRSDLCPSFMLSLLSLPLTILFQVPFVVLKRKSLFKMLLLLLLVYSFINNVHTMNINNVWSPSDSYVHIIGRFAFNKMNILTYKNVNIYNNYGYIYGNISSMSHPYVYKRKGTLLLLPNDLFNKLDKIYKLSSNENSDGNGDNKNNSDTCERISTFIDQYAYDEQCQSERNLDYIRYVPCKQDSKCTGGFESLTSSARAMKKTFTLGKSVPGYQFTFAIEDQKEPTFWYLMLLSCTRENNLNSSKLVDNLDNTNKINQTSLSVKVNGTNTSAIASYSIPPASIPAISCAWRDTSNDNIVINYNIWFVNGYPKTSSGNIFTHQFSYERQDMVLYLIFICFYLILTTLQLYAFIKQRHRNLLVYLFTISLSMHCLAFFFITIHKFVYAHDGVGCLTIFIIADVLRIISTGIFILFVLIIVKGWPVTRAQLTAKPLVFISWLVYIIIEILLYTWMKRSQDPLRDVDDNYILPGWISIFLRIAFTIWFVFELRATMMLEQDQQKLRFYLHFGAGIMVWFVHLPIVIIIGNQISQMWRYKLILGFTCAANFLAYTVVTNFIWPTKQSNRFLTHYVDSDYSEELDCYEDTHIDTLGPLTHQNGINGHTNRYAYENHVHKQSKG